MEKELVIHNIESMMHHLEYEHLRAIYMIVKELYKLKAYHDDSTKNCQNQ